MATKKNKVRESPCPSAAVLAAFTDGALEDTERAGVTEHVTSCSACYETVSGTALFLEAKPVPAYQGPTLAPTVTETARLVSENISAPPRDERAPTSFPSLGAMVSAAVLILAMGGPLVFSLLTRGQRSFQREPEIADLQQNARDVLDMVSRDVLQAG